MKRRELTFTVMYGISRGNPSHSNKIPVTWSPSNPGSVMGLRPRLWGGWNLAVKSGTGTKRYFAYTCTSVVLPPKMECSGIVRWIRPFNFIFTSSNSTRKLRSSLLW